MDFTFKAQPQKRCQGLRDRVSAMLVLLGLLAGVLAAPVQGATASPLPYALPDSLASWVDWVLAKHPDRQCPWQAVGNARASCVWVSQLSLDVQPKQTKFQLRVQAYAPQQVLLPGDANLWPVAVTLNGKRVAVVRNKARPALQVPAGQHQIGGEFQYQQRPESLALPTQHGILQVRQNGEPVLRPIVNASRLFLNKARVQTPSTVPSSLSAEVFRQLLDDTPLRLYTHIRLQVAGPARIETLGRVLPPEYQVMNIESPVPARLRANGNIEVQVEPGEHLIRVLARATTTVSEFSMQAATDNWPTQEIWAFAPRRVLRLASLSGAPGVDLTQVNAPFAANGMQGFLLTPADSLSLVEQQRGDPNPLPGQLSMTRQIWLNFDGSGYVVRDDLAAALRRATRLAANYPLGSVAVDGTPQLVTQLAAGEPGVEMAPGKHKVRAVSAVSRQGLNAAVGWNLDADSLSATLHLPPGYRLLWTSGVDSAPTAWLSRWTLWDLFLVILSVVLAWRYLGLGFCVLLATTLLIAYQESLGFAFVWLLLILVLVVLPYLTHNGLNRWLRGAALALAGVTVFSALVLAVDHVRQGLYPQLSLATAAASHGPVHDTYGMEPAMAPAPSVEIDERSMGSALTKSSRPGRKEALEEIVVTATQQRYPEGMQVQTGPGQPDWNWVQAPLRWHGPVAASQPMQFTLMPPMAVRVWHWLVAASLLLVSGLLFLQLLPKVAKLPGWLSAIVPRPNTGHDASGSTNATHLSLLVVGVSLAAGLLSMAAAPTQAAVADKSTPSPQLLTELEERLLKPPECLPGCVSIGLATLTIAGDDLTLVLEVHAAAKVAVPLPRAAKGWRASDVSLVNGPASVTGGAGGGLVLALEPGVHLVRMVGSLAQLAQVELQFPIAPALVKVTNSKGWRVRGLRNQRLVRNALTLEAIATTASSAATAAKISSNKTPAQLQAEVAPAYVRVERHLAFGLDWRVSTTVTRLAPVRGSFSVEVGLLPGEAVLEGGVNTAAKTTGAVAQLVFGARQSVVRWQSRLASSPELKLVAPSVAQQQEVWSFSASNLWHLHYQPEGSLVASTIAGRDGPVFYPRSNEQLTLQPEASTPIPGSSVTVHGAQLKEQPGERLVDSTLTLRIQSSQGGDYALTLPPGAELTEVAIDGQSQPLSLRDSVLDLPLVTGHGEYKIGWRTPAPLGLVYRTAEVQVPGALTNLSLNVDFPRDRWVLALGGPSLGPALLFWGVVVVVALVGWLLSRLPGSALRTSDALLLAFGLTLCNFPTAVLVALWVLALRAREQYILRIAEASFRNVVQVLTAALTVVTVLALVTSVPMALLGSPDMQVVGNNSGDYFYRWYADQANQSLPLAWVFSLPLWVYRVAMLAWSLWLAFALLRWLRWAWVRWSQPQSWWPKDATAATPAPEMPQQPSQEPPPPASSS